MMNHTARSGKPLRRGYTTGSCAAAAARAAAYMLLTGNRLKQISLTTPSGEVLTLTICEISMCGDRVRCAVQKDAGDDPDVTNGALVFADVQRADTAGIVIDGGPGVGRVTKKGLDQPVGAAAINSVPRRMIEENVREICRLTDFCGGLRVVISVLGGEDLAKRTFNPRLGIEGGISILGTTGIVEPMSEQALLDTIAVELRQRRANGARYVLLTPGSYGSEFIRGDLGVDPALAVQVSNFIGDALDMCRELDFCGVLLIGHIGKLVKLAGGMLNTHSRYGDCRMEILAAHAGAAGLDAKRISGLLECVACDDALRILDEAGLKDETLRRLTRAVGTALARRAGETLEAGAVLFSKEYGLLCGTENAEALLHYIMEG